MRVRRGWEGRAMSTTDSVAGGSPGPGTPGAGPSADMSPQAGPRAPGAVPGAAPGRGRKRLTDREQRNLRMGLLFLGISWGLVLTGGLNRERCAWPGMIRGGEARSDPAERTPVRWRTPP